MRPFIVSSILSTILLLTVTSRHTHTGHKVGVISRGQHGRRHGKHTAVLSNQVDDWTSKLDRVLGLDATKHVIIGVHTNVTVTYQDITDGLTERFDEIYNELECVKAVSDIKTELNEEAALRYKALFEEVYKLFYNVRSVTTDTNIPSTSIVKRETIEMRNYSALQQDENDAEKLLQLKLKCSFIHFYRDELPDVAGSMDKNSFWDALATFTEKVKDSDLMKFTISKSLTNDTIIKSYSDLFKGHFYDAADDDKHPEYRINIFTRDVEKDLKRYAHKIALMHTAFRDLMNIDDGACFNNLAKLFKDIDIIDSMGTRIWLTSYQQKFVEKTSDDVKSDDECFMEILIVYHRLFNDLCEEEKIQGKEIPKGTPARWVTDKFHGIAPLIVKRIKDCNFKGRLGGLQIDLENTIETCAKWQEEKNSCKMKDTSRDEIKSWWKNRSWWTDGQDQSICLSSTFIF